MPPVAGHHPPCDLKKICRLRQSPRSWIQEPKPYKEAQSSALMPTWKLYSVTQNPCRANCSTQIGFPLLLGGGPVVWLTTCHQLIVGGSEKRYLISGVCWCYSVMDLKKLLSTCTYPSRHYCEILSDPVIWLQTSDVCDSLISVTSFAY